MASQRKDPVPDTALNIESIIAAFSEEQVERIAKLKKSRLRYWARTEFFKPSFVGENPKLPYTRFYSFKDIVALRTLEMLRVQNGVPLQHLRKVAERLSHLRNALWTETTLFVVDKKVAFVNPETGNPQEVLSGQYLLGIPLGRVIDDTRSDVLAFRQRPAEAIGQVDRSRAVARNAWVIKGTRIPIASIRRLHEDGYSDEQIMREYPSLAAEDIKAALQHGESKAA